jgi:hypothetical protein
MGSRGERLSAAAGGHRTKLERRQPKHVGEEYARDTPVLGRNEREEP